MRTRLLRYFLRLEYAFASLLTVALVWLMLLVSDSLPEADDTSFLNPILDRIDFLNIADVSLDAIFAVRDAEYPDTRIKIVNVGEVAPTPDGMIAMLLYKLHAQGARVIGLDIFLDNLHIERFPEERSGEVEVLAQALREIPNVVLVNGFREATRMPAVQPDARFLGPGVSTGFANLITDDDGVVRRFLPWANIGNERWLGLPIQMLHVYDSSIVEPLRQRAAVPQVMFFPSTCHQFESVPLVDVVYGNAYDNGFFKDAIVLVGFVNEGGLFYLGDTHKTPMGKKYGQEGPDMPGLLIHANVINMLLRGSFIYSVPVWVDWLLALLLAYASIALYRVLRTKPANRFGVAMLITGTLFTEAVLVFFLPLIAFFYFDVKISYNLMATVVVLFIPASAMTAKLRFALEHRRLRRAITQHDHPLARVFEDAFKDDEPFAAHTRLLHACLFLVQYAWTWDLARALHAKGAPIAGDMQPGLREWRRRVRSIDDEFAHSGDTALQRQYFLRYLEGKKLEFLRESAVKERYFSTELPTFNEFIVLEELELIQPHARRLLSLLPVEELLATLWVVDASGARRVTAAEDGAETDAVTLSELPHGVYVCRGITASSPLLLSPLCEWAECKLHRTHELFVFSAMVRKQHDLPTVPVYLGAGPNCEPVLPPMAIARLRSLEQMEKA